MNGEHLPDNLLLQRRREEIMRHGRKKVPSLVDLCIQMAIDNIRYIGDVGETDARLLEEILPHCTVDQLEYIESSTEGRDLSSVTDKLWKRFYEREFGVDSVNVVIKRMKQKQVAFKWRLLYEAKKKEREQAQKKSVDRLKQLYSEENNRKQSRQIQICSKVPPTSNKRNWSGGSGFSPANGKGSLMKKARHEFLNSHEVKMHAAIRRNTIQRSLLPRSIPRSTNLEASNGSSSSASASKSTKPLVRR